MYGYAGGHYAAGQIFNVQDNKIVIRGRGDKRWTWVHVDDLAQAYVLSVKRAAQVSGNLFFIGAYNSRTYEELAVKAAAVAGHKDAVIERVAAEGWYVIENISCRVSSKKAHDLLGWTAAHRDFYDDLAIYYQCWKNVKH